jgi:hypothetical protein
MLALLQSEELQHATGSKKIIDVAPFPFPDKRTGVRRVNI